MTIGQILDSLNDYWRPTNAQEEHNIVKLEAQYDANHMITTLFEWFDEFRKVEWANGTPYPKEQLIQKFLTLMDKIWGTTIILNKSYNKKHMAVGRIISIAERIS